MTTTLNHPWRARARGRIAILGLLLTACAETVTPPADPTGPQGPQFNHNSGAHADRGHIAGWLDGEEVSLHYTKSYFCAEPPSSGATTDCELGAEPEVEPRPGPIPIIYAVAAVGIQPDPATLSCRPASPCLNHPAMIDASRIGGSATAPGIPHSHIVTERRGGWFETVNVRVFDLGVWNQIAAAKSLEKVRELQADPAVGGAGLISQDTPTNIYFFLQVQSETQ